MDKFDEEIVNDAARAALVKGVFVQDEYGTRKSVFCGRSVALDLLQRGLWISFDGPVDPETVNRPSCYLTVDIPFPLGESERSAWGNQPVGSHSLCIAAHSQLSRANEIHWCPQNNVAAFLERVLVADRQSAGVASFANDWEVCRSDIQLQQWRYSADGNAVHTYGTVAGNQAQGNVCVYRQAVENDAQYVGLSARTQNGEIGIVFNWKSEQDYWVFLCEMHPLLGQESSHIQYCQATIMHFIRGSVIHKSEDPMLRCESPEYVDLDIKQATYGLIFGGQVRSTASSGRTTWCTPLGGPSMHDVPTKFDLGSRIGLFGRLNHSALFTRMDVVYPDVKLQLIPPSGQTRLMVRLVIGNSLMRDKPSQPDAKISSSGGMSSYPGFEMWFWLTLSHELYGSSAYGYRYGLRSGHVATTYRGIGADLI